MNSRDRVFAAQRLEKPDRVPYFDYVLLPPLACEILGHKFIDFGGDDIGWLAYADEVGWEKAVRSYACDRVELSIKLGHDLLYSVPAPVGGGGPPLPDTGDPVENVRCRLEARQLTRASSGRDPYLVYDFLIEEMQRHGVDFPILAPACGHGIWTDVDLMMTMVIDSRLAHEHFSQVSKAMINSIDKYMQRDIQLIMVGGDFAGNRPLISPDMYRCFIMPEVRRCVDYIHSKGGYAINASDGDLWGVIDDFLIGTDADGYNEIDMSVGMDLRTLHERFGNRVCLYGNMDCGNLLSYGTPEQIARVTVQCLDACGGKGHIFSASNAIAASVPMQNYAAMHRAYRDYYELVRLL